MFIRDDRLYRDKDRSVKFEETENVGGGLPEPKYLIMHYTAGSSFRSTVDWFKKPEAKASAHLVIGRNGQIVQMVSFDKVAWHAGASRWRGLDGLNNHAIGIELDNAGMLTAARDAHGNRIWLSWFQKEYPRSQVRVARHQHMDELRGWHRYTDRQIRAAAEVARTLVDHYGIRDVIGHDDIAPTRKFDPGPAFPMESFRSFAMGRKADHRPKFRTTMDLWIRVGPGVEFATLKDKPLPKGTELEFLGREAGWVAVEAPGPDSKGHITGWVHGDYIEEV